MTLQRKYGILAVHAAAVVGHLDDNVVLPALCAYLDRPLRRLSGAHALFHGLYAVVDGVDGCTHHIKLPDLASVGWAGLNELAYRLRLESSNGGLIIVEADEALMERYFADETISAEELRQGLEPLRLIRQELGDSMAVAMEFHWYWNLPCAIRILIFRISQRP